LKKNSLVKDRCEDKPITMGNLRDGKDFGIRISLKPSVDILFYLIGIGATNDDTFHKFAPDYPSY
jgi:hypothetical protein